MGLLLEVLLLSILLPMEHWEWYPSIFSAQGHEEWALNIWLSYTS